MTDSVTIWGLHHVVGRKVAAFIAGLDCGDYTVQADGSITVPFGSDPDGLLGVQSLAWADGFVGDQACQVSLTDGVDTLNLVVPVVIGYTYTSRGQILRAATESASKSPQGPALGKTRRTHMLSALLYQTGGISFGTSFAQLLPANFRNLDQTATLYSEPFSGVYWRSTDDGYSFDSQVCWEVKRPYTAVVVSFGAFLETQDR